MRKTALSLTVFAVVVAVLSVQARAQRGGTAAPADLVLTNGRIVTVEDAQPEVQAMAVTGDKITALGSAADMKPLIGPNTKVVDLKGQLAIPGFIESHGHFPGVGGAQLQLNLMNVQSWDEIVRMVADA